MKSKQDNSCGCCVFILVLPLLLGAIDYFIVSLNSEIRRRAPFQKPTSKEALAEMMLGYWRVDLLGGKRPFGDSIAPIIYAFRPIGSEEDEWGRHDLIEPAWAPLARIIMLEFGDGTSQRWRSIDSSHIEIETTAGSGRSRRPVSSYAYQVRFNVDGTRATWVPVLELSDYGTGFKWTQRRYREQHRKVQCIYLGRFKKGSDYFNEARVDRRVLE